ncbi:MAG: CopG family transcriptional regulator [Clostridiaceae bacterium]
MSLNKKFMMYLKLEKIKNLKKINEKNGEFICHGIIIYYKGQKTKNNQELENGYREMAKINLRLSEEGNDFALDTLKEYEMMLSECDMPDDRDSEKRRYFLC